MCSDDSRSDDPNGPPHGSLHKHNSYPSNHPHSNYSSYNSYNDTFYRKRNYNNYNSYGDRGYNRPYMYNSGRGSHNVYTPPMYMGPVIYLSPYYISLIIRFFYNAFRLTTIVVLFGDNNYRSYSLNYSVSIVRVLILVWFLARNVQVTSLDERTRPRTTNERQ